MTSKRERREKLDPNSVKPPLGTGINTTATYAKYNAAMQQSLIPGSTDTRDHRGNPQNAKSFQAVDPQYSNPYSEQSFIFEQTATIDPTKVNRSQLRQSEVPGRLKNKMPVDYRPLSPSAAEGDAMESARLAMYASNRGLPPGGMGIEGVKAAHMDGALYADANAGKGFMTTMSVDAGERIPGSTKQVIRKGNSKGIA